MEDIFCWQHIVYLLISIAFVIGMIFLVRYLCRNNVKNKKYYVFAFAIVTLIIMLVNKFAIWDKYDNNWKVFVPGSFCSTLAIYGPLVMLLTKPNSRAFNFAIFAQALGGLLTMVYPEFMLGKNNFFDLVDFTGLLFHTMMFLNFVFVLGIGYFKPSMKNWSSFVWGLIAMVPFILFTTQVFGVGEDMYLTRPAVEGTMLYWWVIGILAIIIYTIFLLIYEQFAYKKEERFVYITYHKLKEKFSKKKKEDKPESIDE